MASFAFLSSAIASPIVSIGTVTSETNNGGGGYTNASSIVPGAGDIAIGSTVVNTNYVATNEAASAPAGFTVVGAGVLVDGQTAADPSNRGNASLNPNEATSGANAAFDLGGGASPWYAEFKLPGTYNISSAQVITGHQDGRASQDYDLLVSSDGVNFYSLSNGTDHTIPNPTSSAATAGTGFSYSTGSGASQTTITPTIGGLLATGVNYVEFVDLSGGGDVYREVAFYGIAVPEPSSIVALAGMLSVGLIGLVRYRRRRDCKIA